MDSFDQSQLSGSYQPVSALSACAPIVTVGDLGVNIKSVSNKTLDPSWPAIPCGLIAKSYFSDNFTIYMSGQNTSITINQ